MGRALPAKTGLPLLFDTDMATTVDFHIASTNFTKCLNDYINEISAFYIFNSTKFEADPITAQAEFFARLNDGKLDLRDNYGGSFNEFTYMKSDVGYTLAKLDTLLQSTETWVITDGKPEARDNGDGTWSFYAYNLETDKYRWVHYKEHTKKEVDSKAANLKNGWGMKDVNEEFLLYWKEKFDKCHYKVKEEYGKLVKNPRYDFFTELSDSVGILSRVKEAIDAFTIPLADVKLNSAIPSVINPIAADKLDRHTISESMELSKRTNILFRQNLVNVKAAYYLESQNTNELGSHGTVLVSDYAHNSRMSEMAVELIGKAADAIGSSFRILTQLTIANNEQKIVYPKLEMVIEDSLYKVNLLKEKVQPLTKTVTNDQVLKAYSSNIIDQS